MIGSVLGEWEVIRPLGVGGFADIYEARSRKTGVRAAIQLIRGDFTSDSHRDRVVMAAKRISRVRAPGLAQIYDAGLTSDGMGFIAMEYLRGETLESLLRNERVDSQHVARFAGQVARAALALHEQGIFHRDIKPANIVLSQDWDAALTDFSAVAVPAGEPEPGFVGTPGFIAPEVIRDPSSLSPSCDIYSLGATMYTALTGSAPFGEGSVAQILHRQLDTPGLDPRTVVPVAPRLADLVLRMTAPQPEMRPPSMRVVAHELAALTLAGEHRTAAISSATRMDAIDDDPSPAIVGALPHDSLSGHESGVSNETPRSGLRANDPDAPSRGTTAVGMVGRVLLAPFGIVVRGAKGIGRFVRDFKISDLGSGFPAARSQHDVLFLNMWFPDQPKRFRAAVGQPILLRVNIGRPVRKPGAKAEQVSAAGTAAAYATDHVDVIVVAPGADISPTIGSLPMPPDPERRLDFTIVPLFAGQLRLTVLLLVRGDPIHRSMLPLEVLPTDKNVRAEQSAEDQR